MGNKIEILPWSEGLLKGFLVIFPNNMVEKQVDGVWKKVFVYLMEHGYTPKQTGVERRDGVYCFQVIVKEERPGLLEDLKQAIEQAIVITKKGRKQ